MLPKISNNLNDVSEEKESERERKLLGQLVVLGEENNRTQCAVQMNCSILLEWSM